MCKPRPSVALRINKRAAITECDPYKFVVFSRVAKGSCGIFRHSGAKCVVLLGKGNIGIAGLISRQVKFLDG